MEARVLLEINECIGYLQVFLIVAVFALGLPAVVFETAFSAELKDIARRRTRHGYLIIAVGLTVFSVGAIMFIMATSPIVNEKIFLFSRSGVIAVLNSLLVGVLGLVLLWWRAGVRLDLRKSLLTDLGRRGVREIKREREVNPSTLEDIVRLGAYSKAGLEKQDAIGTLEELVSTLFEVEYDGRGAEDLVRGILEAVCSEKGREGDAANFVHAASVLGAIWGKLERLNLERRSDGNAVSDGFVALSTWSASRFPTQVSLAILQRAPLSSEVAFETGRVALELNDFRLVAACMSQLESLARGGEALVEAYHLLGLAGLTFGRGDGLKRRSLLSIRSLGRSRKDLVVLIMKAENHHYLTGRLDVVDALVPLLSSVATRP